MNNIFENFIEKKKFNQWLLEKKSISSAKSSIEDYIDEYGEEDGKKHYYKTRKGAGKKHKKKMNEVALSALVGGAVALGIGARMIGRYGKVNRRLKTAAKRYETKYGKKPGKVAMDNLAKGSFSAERQQETQKFHRWFQPETTTNVTSSGRFGPTRVVQPRGTIRDWIKSKVSGTFKSHPIINSIAMDLGRKAADHIHTKFTNPEALYAKPRTVNRSRRRP